MRSLFCCMELVPFSKVGGLADVCSALPKALNKQGVQTAIVTPYHKSVAKKNLDLEHLHEHDIEIPVGKDRVPVRYLKTTMPEHPDITVFFVQNDSLFLRDGIYINPSSGKEYSDNPKRYIVFNKAILELVKKGLFEPDIFHLHDHHTALIPAMILSNYKDHPVLGKARSMMTIHNMAYQGICGDHHLQLAELSEDLIAPKGDFQLDGDRVNFLKLGIHFVDKVNTVSETYANETREVEHLGYGLSETLRQKGEDYLGILNGVDYEDWNPETDPYIVKPYSIESVDQKRENRSRLLANNGLDYSKENYPVIGMISRLVDHKGVDILAQALEKMLTWDLFFVLLGTGDHRYHRLFEQIKMRFPHKFGLNLTFSNRMAHEIEAGCDFFLMPSRYEPCGLNQMYSMKYGTIPIVRHTGGLADTVQDFNDETQEGWGFVFDDYDAKSLLKTVWRAVTFFPKKKLFKNLVVRSMQHDFSWDVSARKYKQVYQGLLKKGRG